MGCAKNLVDSEKLMAQLRVNQFALAPSLEEADIAVINTCGFIEAAKQESIDMIIDTARQKGKGRLKRVVAMGCLTERYVAELRKEIPEVDAFVGSNDLPGVLRALGGDYRRELLGERVLTTPGGSAYVKISEGCDNPCSFCAIPLMRGKHRSRPLEEILQETQLLAAQGVREIVLIAQDTTYYGLDLYGKRVLAHLLETVADTPGIEWVRLMYAYPAKFPVDVLDVIADHPRVCTYLDMPVQHVSDTILRSMRRGISTRALLQLLENVRTRVPDIALRTTLIVGYPGEREKEFEELVQFVEGMRFDRLGVFTYSREDGTTAFELGDTVPSDEKERRRAVIMELQQGISAARNEALIGTRQKVLVERKDGDVYAGRTERDAPEIDGEVFITSARPLEPGEFHEVEIVDATEYDMYATL